MELEQLLKLIDAVSNSSLTAFKYEEKGVKLSLHKGDISGGTGISAAGNATTVSGAEMAGNTVMVKDISVAEDGMVSDSQSASGDSDSSAEGNIVKSPLVGTFYAAPSEDAEPFVKVGDQVEKGQVLAIVEAMKLMNDIESEYSGKIAEIYVENGDAVEYGQPLFRMC